MGNWDKFNVRKSFGARITLIVLFTALVVFVGSFGTGLLFAERQMLADGHDKANLELDKAVLYVNTEMENVEVAGKNFVNAIPSRYALSPDSLFSLFEHFLSCNPDVQGVAIGFEPWVYKGYKRGFAPYVMKRNGGYARRLLGDVDDFYRKDWYQTTRKGDTCRWSNPFFEVNGSVICSYCIPLHDAQGHFMGVLAVDLSLAQFTEHLQKVKPYPNSFLTVMDRHLNFVVHPDISLILRGNPQKIIDQSRFEVNETIFVDIRNRVRGIGAFGEKGKNKFLYYAPVKRCDWTITLECSQSDILAGVTAIRRQMIVVSLLAILLLSVLLPLLMSPMLRPIHLYARAARRIAEGNFHTVLPRMKWHNELWRLGQSLDHMQHSLDHYVKDLEKNVKERSRIDSELTIASRIQMSMIPKIFPPYPDRDDIDLYGLLIPAKAVGGDLFDFFMRDEKLFLCIGDVSGKGVPASLVMAVTRSLVRIVAAKESHPGRIVTSINHSMADTNDSNMFVTLFVGVLDLPTGRFRYCNAGHNAPVVTHVDQGGKANRLPVESNLPVAILQDMKYEEQEVVIQPGTTIFLYTDGVTEAEDEQQNLYGEQRLDAALAQVTALGAQQQVEHVLDDVHRFSGSAPQSDDLTMLAFQYKRISRDNKLYKKLTLRNDVHDVHKIAGLIDDLVGETGIEASLATNLNLALEEAVVNVMNYAYPKGTTGSVQLEAMLAADTLNFVITDSGTPFDPTSVEDADVTLGVEDRPVGGLGIFLVRQIMDTVNYERVDGHNILTLSKKIEKTT